MSSILKVNEIQDGGANSILASDGSGNLTTQNILYPAFFAHSTADQTVTSDTDTKVQFPSEVIDTNSAYDTSNYRFTVPSGKAGKYIISYNVTGQADAVARLQILQASIRKNGSVVNAEYGNIEQYYYTNNLRHMNISTSCLLDLAVSDYIEIYIRITVSAGTPSVSSTDNFRGSWFQGYRIGS